MTTDIDEDFFYVTNSLRRMDVMYVLGSVDFARNGEIADILCISAANVSNITRGLAKHGLLNTQKSEKYKIYSLSDKGKDIVQKLRIYHGID